MLEWRTALLAGLSTGLLAQDGGQGFSWVGLRGGSLSFDPAEKLRSAPSFGAQGGRVFDEGQYGLSFEAASVRAKSDLYPGQRFTHRELSATWLTGLAGGSPGRFWPYLGVGLGSTTVALDAPSAATMTLRDTLSAHAAFGLLHRPAPGFLWGAEARWVTTLSSNDRQSLQGAILVGFTWGAPKPAPPAPVAPAKRTEAPKPLAPPAPTPAVKAPPTPALPSPAAGSTPAPAAPTSRSPTPVAKPVPAPTAAAPPARAPVAKQPAAPAPVAKPTPAPVAPVAAPAVDSLDERLDALRQSDLGRAVVLGRARIRAIPAQHWTLRLEVANLASTLKDAVEAFRGNRPDLFIAPIRLRDGRTAYQLFLGDHPTREAAERAIQAVPRSFFAGGERPLPILVGAIPERAAR